MTSLISSRCARSVLSIDTPDDVRAGVRTLGEPSADLLDRARVGWEHFTASGEDPSDG